MTVKIAEVLELQMPNYKYQVGDKIGVNKDIILLERIKPISKGKGYLCRFKCPYCGKEFQGDLYKVNAENFGCGCYRDKYVKFQPENLTGQRFGYLEAIKDTGKRVTTTKGEKVNAIWLCKCLYPGCNNFIEVSTSHLKDGHTLSCGRHNISKGEFLIEFALKELGIEYIPEKKFDDCRSKKTNCLLRFDFYLPDYNCCIEYNGEQHYNIPQNQKSSFFTKESIEQIQGRDKEKIDYCRKKNIYIIIIPYTELDKISSTYLLEKIKTINARKET